MNLVFELVETFLTGVWKFECMMLLPVGPAVGAESCLEVDVANVVWVGVSIC